MFLIFQVSSDSSFECLELGSSDDKTDCLVLNLNVVDNKHIAITLNYPSKIRNDKKYHFNQVSRSTENMNSLENYNVGKVSDVSTLQIYFSKMLNTFQINILSDARKIIRKNVHFVLVLSENKIKIIRKDSFKDFVDLETLHLYSNLLETLDDNTLAYNTNLKWLNLNNNKLKRLSALLFSRNTKLEFLNLRSNEISQIEEGFDLNLVEIKELDLKGNLCIDTTFDFYYIELNNSNKQFLTSCYTNFEKWNELNNSKLTSVDKNVDSVRD